MKNNHSIGRRVFVAGRTLVLAYAGMIVILAGCQRQLIYHPQRGSEQELIRRAGTLQLEPWRDEADIIIGWRTRHSEASQPKNAMVVFHGNAGYALHRVYYADGFGAIPGADAWQVFFFEYPGYGAREGSPSERVITRSAEEAIELLIREGRRVFVTGESLGSGVASYLAGKHPEEIAGVLLITPFTSLKDVGRRHYRFFPVGLLLRERYDNLNALRAYQGPVVFLLAGRDEVIPASLGQRLHDEYEGPKKLIVQEESTHNTLNLHSGMSWWSDTAAFLLDP